MDCQRMISVALGAFFRFSRTKAEKAAKRDRLPSGRGAAFHLYRLYRCQTVFSVLHPLIRTKTGNGSGAEKIARITILEDEAP